MRAHISINSERRNNLIVRVHLLTVYKDDDTILGEWSIGTDSFIGYSGCKPTDIATNLWSLFNANQLDKRESDMTWSGQRWDVIMDEIPLISYDFAKVISSIMIERPFRAYEGQGILINDNGYVS